MVSVVLKALKMKVCVATVNNSFQSLPIFCQKELHLRGHIGFLGIFFFVIVFRVKMSPFIMLSFSFVQRKAQ